LTLGEGILRTSATAAGQGPFVRNRVTASNVTAILDQIALELVAANKDDPWAQSLSVGIAIRQVPVFRNGQFSGFVERNSVPYAVTRNDQGDVEMQRRLSEAIGAEDWFDPEHVGIAVEGRVVRLSGRGESPHAVLALRRLAASASCVAAIIDDLWIDYE
jgi:hypothetical protein